MTFKLFSIKTASHDRMKCEAYWFKVVVLCCGYLSWSVLKVNVLTCSAPRTTKKTVYTCLNYYLAEYFLLLSVTIINETTHTHTWAWTGAEDTVNISVRILLYYKGKGQYLPP